MFAGFFKGKRYAFCGYTFLLFRWFVRALPYFTDDKVYYLYYTEQFVLSQAFWNKMFHNKDMNKFAERLRELRTEKGMSRKEIAEKLGVLQRNISYWELGQRECGFDMLIKISEVLDVSIDYLLGKTDY